MKTLIKFILFAIIVLLGYNYFFGDEKEQEQAEKIVGKVKDLGSDIKALVLSEKDKYDDGKYDDTVDKISELIKSVREKISNVDLKNLEDKQEELKEAIEKLKSKSGNAEEQQKEEIESDIQNLYEDIKKAVEKI